MEKACDLVHITLNKNAVVGDVSALAPGGVRIGAPAMTSRGLREADFETIANFLTEARAQRLLLALILLALIFTIRPPWARMHPQPRHSK